MTWNAVSLRMSLLLTLTTLQMKTATCFFDIQEHFWKRYDCKYTDVTRKIDGFAPYNNSLVECHSDLRPDIFEIANCYSYCEDPIKNSTLSRRNYKQLPISFTQFFATRVGNKEAYKSKEIPIACRCISVKLRNKKKTSKTRQKKRPGKNKRGNRRRYRTKTVIKVLE